MPLPAPRPTPPRPRARERLDDLGLGDHIQRPPAGQQQPRMGKRLEPPAQPARRPANALGGRPQLSVLSGEERDDAIRLAQRLLPEDDRLRLIDRHAGPAPPPGGTDWAAAPGARPR